MSEPEHAVYVYGVVAKGERTGVKGPGVGRSEAAVRRVKHRDVAALVSDVDRGPLGVARDLRSHWRVLEEAVAGATVLPVRFGTVMEDDAAVVDEFLAPNHDRLAAALAELSGKVQLTVKGFYDEDRLLRGVVSASSDVARLGDRVRSLPEAATYYDRIRLGELVAAEVDAARDRDAALVIGRLGPLAVAARSEPVTTPDAAVTAAFLVERDAVERFGRAVSELADEIGERMRIRFVGPLPPYSFADEEVAAWA